jgi:Ca-activated chloride channel homolog
MAQQDKKKSVVGSRRSAVLMAVAAFMLIAAAELKAGSLASKNKEGNRLFEQGKYEEAEKAYLEAQVKNPGKPEVIYNLGNSLIKQKKYTQGIQSLHQSIDKGNKGTQKNSWYNTGNALYSMGNFKESAEAFIQALKLDPTDSDAKHNLELALMKLKQQQQKQSDKNQNKQNSDKSKQDPSSGGKDGGQQKPQQNEQTQSADKKSRDQQQKSQRPQEAQREGSISKEQAAQILDALQNQELEQQRKLLEGRARRKTTEKDW